MKRLLAFIFFLLSLHIFFVGAYEIEVESFSELEVLLSLSDLETINLKIINVQATVESDTISDTYTVEAMARTDGERVLIAIDISPIFQDYTSEQVQSILVYGELEIDAENIKFGKRIPIRNEETKSKIRAPNLDEYSTLIYWIVGLALILVLLILILFYRKPKARKKVSLLSQKKIKVKKKKVLKKKTKKKLKKRL